MKEILDFKCVFFNANINFKKAEESYNKNKCKDAEEKFIRIKKAYEVLTDPKRKNVGKMSSKV